MQHSSIKSNLFRKETNMKRIISVLLIVFLILTSGCRKGKSDDENELYALALAMVLFTTTDDCDTGNVTVSAYKDSPFGIFGPYEFEVDRISAGFTKYDANHYLLDIGAKWIQVKYCDENSVPGEIQTYGRVGKEGLADTTRITDLYRNQLREVIRLHKDRTKYWEAGTEPDGFPPPMGWKGRPDAYAEFLKETYLVIKSECSECKVIFGGIGGIGATTGLDSAPAVFLKEVLTAGGGKYIDGFAFKQHRYNAGDYQLIKNRMDDYSGVFSDFGIDLRSMPVFLETATHDGYPNSTSEYLSLFPIKAQTEKEQAMGLFKMYIYSAVQGVSKIFWNLIFERYNFGNDPGSDFNFYGLVNNPLNDGVNYPKLAYYTYKKMAEVLEGADWKNIQTVQESGDIYVYRFTKGERIIHVAWWDYFNDPSYTAGMTKDTVIGALSGVTVTKTEAVPMFSSGKDVTDYGNAFKKNTVDIVSGSVTMSLGEEPVFVETDP